MSFTMIWFSVMPLRIFDLLVSLVLAGVEKVVGAVGAL